MSDEIAAKLPIPPKEALLGYLRASYETCECIIELFDTKYSGFDNVDEMIHRHLLVFLSHDCRHLGMMECLKGLQTPHASIHPFAQRAGQTGFGSATEQRK